MSAPGENQFEQQEPGYFFFSTGNLDTQPGFHWKDPFRNQGNEERQSGIIVMKIKALQPLIVSDGVMRTKETSSFFRFYRNRGKAFIPGSSFKGSLRTYLGLFASPSFADALLGTIQRGEEHCALVETNDIPVDCALVEHYLPQQYGPREPSPSRNQYRVYKNHVEQAFQRTHRFEAVPQGVVLETTLSFRGLRKKDVGLFLMALGCHPSHGFAVKMGRGKGINCGSVQLVVKEIHSISRPLSDPNPKVQDATVYLNDFQRKEQSLFQQLQRKIDQFTKGGG